MIAATNVAPIKLSGEFTPIASVAPKTSAANTAADASDVSSQAIVDPNSRSMS